MRPLLPSLLAGLALGALAVPTAAPAAARAKTHRATCDELKGTTYQRNDKWRIFGSEADTFNAYLTACRRSDRPVTRLLRLGAWASAPDLSGDLLHVENEGRYDNCAGYVADLVAHRFTLTHDCGTPGRADLLQPSGALVRFGNLRGAAVNGQSRLVGDIAVNGTGGALPVANDASDVVPFPATASGPEGFYYTAADGTLQRRTTGGRTDTAGWNDFGDGYNAFTDARVEKTRARVKTVPGRATTYLGSYELRRDRATGGRKASLTVRYPNAETMGSARERSDLLARLVPGSAAEFRIVGGVFIGRFADDPGAVRLWVPSFSKAGKPLLTLPYPTDPAAAPFAAGQALAFPTPTGVTLLHGRYYETAPTSVPVALPPGAHDLVATYEAGTSASGAQRRLIYTDAAGQPASVSYTLPTL